MFFDDVLCELFELDIIRNLHLRVFAHLEQVDCEVVDACQDVVWIASLADAVDVAHAFLLRFIEVRSNVCVHIVTCHYRYNAFRAAEVYLVFKLQLT